MNSGAAERPNAELARESAELQEEVRVTRQTSSVTARLVAEQFSRIEEMFLKLEKRAQAEQQLGRELARQLREAEAREGELARERQQLEKMQVAAINMMEDIGAARAAAESATVAKSEFLANMSHEIRTPMTAIMGFANLIREAISCCTVCSAHASCETRGKNQESIETICRNGEHLLQVINDILDISKIEAGKLEIERIRCSPVALVADIQSLMQVRATARNLPLEVEYNGPVPETIQSDPTRLKQILVNVIGNAIKFTEVGSVRLVTSLVDAEGATAHDADGRTSPATPEPMDDRALGPRLQFDVVDTGLGMTAEHVATLFQPFSQADASTTRKFGGTGLGLMISKRLAQMLGGDIVVVETAVRVGTRFRVTVSTGSLAGVKMISDPASAAVIVPRTSKRAVGTDRGALQACRILLAEDGLDNQRLIVHILRKAGADVTVVENGRLAADAALAAANRIREGDPQHPFDVILMDMQMPVMDGYEATDLLRREGYTGPIIALTAHAMVGDRQRCIDAGCDDYATKPIDRKRLIEMIQERRQKRLPPGAQHVRLNRPPTDRPPG